MQIASFLKLFPIFASLSLLRLRRGSASVSILLTGGLFLLYLLFSWDDLPQIFNSTLKGVTIFAYGTKSHWIDIPLLPSLIPAVAIVAITALYQSNYPTMAGNPISETDTNFLDAFRAGAGIYVGTFMLGNNWSYRLIFLILVIMLIEQIL